MGDVVMKDKLRSGLPSLICVLDESITDLIIVCKDGAVCGHQVIIAWASTSVRQWLLSRLLVEKGGNRKEQVTIFLPDVGTAPVSALTYFLLTGQMDIRASKQFGKELEDAWHLLGIDRISFHEVTFGGNTGSVEEGENSQHRITVPPLGPKIVSGKNNVNLSPSIPQNLLHKCVQNSNTVRRAI